MIALQRLTFRISNQKRRFVLFYHNVCYQKFAIFKRVLQMKHCCLSFCILDSKIFSNSLLVLFVEKVWTKGVIFFSDSLSSYSNEGSKRLCMYLELFYCVFNCFNISTGMFIENLDVFHHYMAISGYLLRTKTLTIHEFSLAAIIATYFWLFVAMIKR